MRFVLKRLNLFLIFTLLFAGQLFSQDEDISIENISIVGGEPLCPSSSVQFTVTIKNNDGAVANDISNDDFYFQVNGPINRAPQFYTIRNDGSHNLAAGASIVLTYPEDFVPKAGSSTTTLDLSDHNGPYTITASITIPGDPNLSNNVSTSLDIGVATPTTATLTSNNATPLTPTICAGEEIIFTISPYSATATYTFKVNGGIIQSLAGVNTITFSSDGALGSIANNDIVTIDMIDAFGCIVETSTQSITVSVSNLPTANLTASATDGLICSGDSVTLTATGGVSFTWFINDLFQAGATFSTLTRNLSDNDVVRVRVFNANGCYEEKSLIFNEMTLINNGIIVLENASDSNICSGESPTGRILGDGTGR